MTPDESARSEAADSPSPAAPAGAVERTLPPDAPTRQRRLAQRLALVTAAHAIGVWEIDVDTGAMQWNAQMLALYGIGPDRMPRQPAQWLERHILHEDRERVLQAAQVVVPGSGADWPGTSAHRIEHRIVRGDGSVRWVESQSALVEDEDGRRTMLGTSRDITERKSQEQQLRDALQRLQLATDWARVGVFLRDPTSLAGYWNRQMFDLFGLEPDPLQPTQPPPFEQITERLHPDDRDRYREYWAAIRDYGEITFPDQPLRVLLADGGERWLTVRAHRVASRADAPVAGVAVDITERMASEQRAEEIARRLQVASEAGRIGLSVRDTVTGEGYWNAALLEMNGLPPDGPAPPREHLLRTCHPDDRATLTQAWRELSEGSGVAEYEARTIRPDGSVRWLRSRARAERDANGRTVRVVGAAVDVTEAREASQRLADALRRLELAAEAGGVGIWSRDLRDGSGVWDSTQFRLLDFPPPTVPSREQTIARLHPDDRARALDWWSRMIDTGRSQEIESRVYRADGTLRHLITRGIVERGADGTPLRIVGTTIDVTDVRRTQVERDELMQRLQLATAAVGFGAYEWQPQRGHSEWNDQMYALLGHTRESFRDKVWLDAVHPLDRPLARERMAEAIERGATFALEYRTLWPDGTVRWIATRGQVQRDGGGRAERIIGLHWDITESKLAESALRAQELAERASAAKSEFLSRMSHELRTPLNAILGFTQLLELDAGHPLVGPQVERVAHIRTAGWHLLSLINEVLDLARIESGSERIEHTAVAVDELIGRCVGMMENDAARQGIALEVAPVPASAVALADPVRLKQVLLNLLSNAIKYNREAGRVNLVVTADTAQVRIAVRDTGRGLTPDQIDKLYQPFNRLGLESAPIEGTGIGLVITLRLVERMGGRLDVWSEPGVGSEFSVTLPATKLPPPGENEASAAPA